MKKLISIVLVIVMLLAIMPLTVFAMTGTEGLQYTLSDDGTYYIVSDYMGSAPEVVIPSEYEGLPVKEIGELAFEFCSSLTSITIPNSVTTIGVCAFCFCSSLTSVTIGDSVVTIGEGAFAYCDSLTSITIPDSVTTIGNSAFSGCESLTSITIPDSVTTIGGGAFAAESITVAVGNTVYHSADNCIIETATNTLVCGSKNSVIPDSVTTIGDYAFAYCDNLTSITIPDSVTTIGREAFYWCENLTSITIGNSVTAIGNSAFRYCRLTSITIPDSVTTIGNYAFSSCNPTSVTIPDSVTTIGKGVFYDCFYLSDIYCETNSKPSDWSDDWNDYGHEYCYATVHWGCNFVKVTKQPKTVSVQSGKVARVTVSATGEGLTYKWYFKNKGDSKFTLTNSYKSNTYSLEMNGTRAGRQVYCVITDKYGNEVKTNTVTLGMAVKITKQPTTVSVQSGKQAKVTVSASGEGKTYKWYYKDKSATKFTLTNSFKGDSYYVEMNGTRAGRQVYCVITDKYGNSVKTNTVTLGMAVKITKQPTSVKVANGSQAKVTVTASGEGKTYKWYFKDKGATKFSLTNSFKGDSYYVTMTNVRAGRQIYCVITDKYGNSVKTNTVTLNKK